MHTSFESHLCVCVRGMHLEYLSPYSPDLNPIEEAFLSIKAWIRAHRDHVRAETTHDADNAHIVLGEAIYLVTAEKARAWFTHSGYIAANIEILDT
jgi:hypothetical protein